MSRKAEQYRVIDRGLHHIVSATQFVEYFNAGYIERSVRNRRVGFVTKFYRSKIDASTGELNFTFHEPSVDYRAPELRGNPGPKLTSVVKYHAPFNSWKIHVEKPADFDCPAVASFVCPSQAHDVKIVRDNKPVAEVWVRGQLEQREPAVA